ncbi:MAG: phosphoribosyltransferase [Patescibacteria group bacterium]|nr:phosphoribosyltransferase [Patescibacteria group bacterium]
MVFKDRTDAGRQLAQKLTSYSGNKEVLLYALPRGGVVVGAEVAKVLGLPLDVIVTRKVGAPENEEYAIGAMAETGEVIWNEAERFAHDQKVLQKIIDKEKKEATRRIASYRNNRPLPEMKGKTIIIIDDGVATGLTIRAAVAAARHQHAAKIILAVPHGAAETLAELRREADEVVALEEPEMYGAVGQYYETFPQTSDQEVVELLKTCNS